MSREKHKKGIWGIVAVIVLIGILFGVNYVIGFDGIDTSILENSSEPVISTVEISSELEEEPVSSEDDRPKVTLEFPYYIKVDKGAQIVTVYTTNEEGKYEKVVRHMLCSTGENINKLPDGYYPLKDKRKRWATMFSTTGKPSYAQYTTQITGYFLFHSVTYDAMKEDTLHWKRFNNLGTRSSGGCIRLTVENAKWIQDNCVPGTIVEVCTGPEQPALVKKLQEELGVGTLTASNKYDPTDPNGPNPMTQYPDPDPQPDPYAELYDYNIKFSPECQYTRNTTATTTTNPTTDVPLEETPAVTQQTTAAPTTTPAPAGDTTEDLS